MKECQAMVQKRLWKKLCNVHLLGDSVPRRRNDVAIAEDCFTRESDEFYFGE